MATRSRTNWKLRGDGQYDCRVGWKVNSRGKRDQHRFRLGGDLKEAQRRDHLLRRMWEQVEAIGGPEPVWDQGELELAKLVAKGVVHLHISKKQEEDVVEYAQRCHRLRHKFPMLAILPQADYASAFGVQLLESLDKAYADSEAAIEAQQSADQAAFLQSMSASGEASSISGGPMLHFALKEYSSWLESEYSDAEHGVTSWGRTQVRQVESLIAHHTDMPLASIGRDMVEEMLRYWRQRPPRLGTNQPVTKKSAEHYISALRNFFRWLNARESYAWRKPDGFDEIKTRVPTLGAERRAQIKPEQLFSLDELVLLFRYGKPFDRLMLLLGLNAGFGAAESATLLVGEIYFQSPHTQRQQETLAWESREDDSFIKRVRRKTGVYGEFLLFNETVKGIDWAMRERRRHGDFDQDDCLLLNSRGNEFNKPTRSGNANRQIPNRFVRLIKRIIDDNQQMSKLPFKMLRKTGGDLVKRFSDGEVSGVFLCHGRPVVTDDLSDEYTTRPFGKVFTALRKVEEYLSPMFEAAGDHPFE